MELMGLDAAFQPVGYVPFLNLQWNRRYHEAGNFSLQLRAEDYDPAVRYVYTRERPELGMVQKLESEAQAGGDFVQLSGFFAEKLLDNACIYPAFEDEGTPAKLATQVVAAYPPEGIALEVRAADAGDVTAVKLLGDAVGAAMYELLSSQGMSHKLWFDYERATFVYEVYQGADRTQSQREHPFALFTDQSECVERFELTEDESAYKNAAKVAYGSASKPSLLTVDARTDESEPRRYLYIDLCGTGMSQQQLLQTATERLMQHGRVHQADVSVRQAGLCYLRDYDLGDRCDVVNHRLHRSYETRIIGVDEVFKQGRHLVRCRFGQKAPTTYEKLSRLVRQARRSSL